MGGAQATPAGLAMVTETEPTYCVPKGRNPTKVITANTTPDFSAASAIVFLVPH